MSAGWQWEDDDGWKDYSDADANLLEAAYQARSPSTLVCNGYVVSFPFYAFRPFLRYSYATTWFEEQKTD